MKTEDIARVCHEANRAVCEAFGDKSQESWEKAEQWQRESAIKGVEFIVAHPDARPFDQHYAWMRDKIADGWKYGATKDPVAKTHPCLVEYNELPGEQKAKDYVFQAVARTLLQL